MGLYGIPICIGDAASMIPTILSQHGYMITKERGKDVFVCDTKRGEARFWISTSVPQRWYASLNAPNEEHKRGHKPFFGSTKGVIILFLKVMQHLFCN